jgi:hypothetical protein
MPRNGATQLDGAICVLLCAGPATTPAPSPENTMGEALTRAWGRGRIDRCGQRSRSGGGCRATGRRLSDGDPNDNSRSQ